MVGRSEISMPWCAHGSRGRVPPNSPTSPVLCVDVPAAQGQTCQRLLARLQPPGLALVIPGVLGEGSLGRLGGVVGLAWGAMPGLSASRTGPAQQRMAAARPCIICSMLRVPAEVTGVELFSPGMRPVVATQVMPMVERKVR